AMAVTLTVPLASWTVRALAGPAGGVAAAWWVAESVWHLQFSQMALEPVLLPAEGLVVAGLLLAPAFAASTAAAASAGAVSGIACYGYAAALYLPLWGLAAAASLPDRRRRVAYGLTLALTCGPLALHGGARL